MRVIFAKLPLLSKINTLSHKLLVRQTSNHHHCNCHAQKLSSNFEQFFLVKNNFEYLLTSVHNDADAADNADDANDYNGVIGIGPLKAFSCANKKGAIQMGSQMLSGTSYHSPGKHNVT